MASQAETALKGINAGLGKATRRANALNRATDAAGRRENAEADMDRALRQALDKTFTGSGSGGSLL